MASMRDIKRRKSSITSTQQITKAMKLVSTVKLQKARGRAEETNPYFHYMYRTICSMLGQAGDVEHPYLKGNSAGKKAVVVITSNRGLAGGYNSNVVKLITGSKLAKEDVCLYTVGKKGADALIRRGYQAARDYSEAIEQPAYEDAVRIGRDLLFAYEKGELGEIYLAYTHFKNTVSHEPRLMRLLPVSLKEEKETGAEHGAQTLMNFEPNEEQALKMIIPKYITSLLFGALVEAVASENGARMQAMDSATSNAEEMISDLSLKYNRARQGTITQELTEIIAGAEAIS